MKKEYLKIIEESDLSIFQNYKIINNEYIAIEPYEVKNCIINNIPVKIEILIDWGYYHPLKNNGKLTKMNDGWFWEYYCFEGSKELYEALSKIGLDDSFWKNWLTQSWGLPDYTQIWDGETLFDEDFFDDVLDAESYKEVWEIKGTLEIEVFQNAILAEQ